MRSSVPAIALAVSLLAAGAVWDAACGTADAPATAPAPVATPGAPSAPAQAAAPAAPSAPAPAATPAAPSAPGPATPPSSDAAALHAKRTACRKDAKAKKLVGADKTAFIKSCLAAP